ncbi:MAG TPA: hypothetical protein VGR35_00245 [Tepidisphaeraceae bacterium]|nr:hypothetical protein [Tepidisphaeraceae bacterium]
MRIATGEALSNALDMDAIEHTTDAIVIDWANPHYSRDPRAKSLRVV